MSHTPGPWKREGLSIYGPKHPDSKHKNGRIFITRIVVGTHRADPRLDGGADRFPFDADDDARLIAAAPELLEACERLLAVVEAEPEACGIYKAHAAIARAAIAKAKGE